MSDQHFKGGHELEGLNTKVLFQLFIGLALVTFLACVAVVQWFHRQRNDLMWERAAVGSFLLDQHRSEVRGLLGDIDESKEAVLGDPKLLSARKPPVGWVHPDDVKGAAAAPSGTDHAAPVAEHGPPPTEPGAEGEGHQGLGGPPTHEAGEKAGGEKAEGEGEKGEGEKGEGEKGEEKAGDEKPAKKPVKKPAEKAEEEP